MLNIILERVERRLQDDDSFKETLIKEYKLLKCKKQRVDENVLTENKAVIMQANKNDGDWVAKIYRANGLPYKRRCSG